MIKLPTARAGSDAAMSAMATNNNPAATTGAPPKMRAIIRRESKAD
jgi:hypothetical protein